MKSKLFILMLGVALSTLSVSTNASPPFTDIGIHESLIKQSVTVPSPVIELTAHEVYFISAELAKLSYFVTNENRQPIVHSVCSTDAPGTGVDGRAVLSWCIKDYNYHRIFDLGFHYSEGRATEYQC